jgi:SAM-dependent methyltransferase
MNKISEINYDFYKNDDAAAMIKRGFSWYNIPLEKRVSAVEAIKDQSDKLFELSREIGLNTGTTTSFGRSYDILSAALPEIFKYLPRPHIEVLDIGPGMGMSSIVESRRLLNLPIADQRLETQYSSEPFEIVAELQRNGYSDVELTAFDIDPLVLALIKHQNTLLMERYIPEAADYYRQFRESVDPTAEPVLQSEIVAVNNENEKYADEHFLEAHLVKLPDRIIQAIKTERGDIAEMPENHELYDLIYYLAVSIYVEDKDQALKNVVSRLRNGGLLITTEVENADAFGLEELVRVPYRKNKVCYRKKN